MFKNIYPQRLQSYTIYFSQNNKVEFLITSPIQLHYVFS